MRDEFFFRRKEEGERRRKTGDRRRADVRGTENAGRTIRSAPRT